MSEGFFIEKEWTQTLQGAELLIYAYIATTCKNCGGVCECSKANIAKWTGVSVRTMERPIRRLQERGLLTIQEVAGKYNRYTANPYANCVPLRKMCTPTQNEGETPTQNVYPHIIINNNIKEKRNKRDTRTRAIEFVAPEYRETFEEWLQYKKERRDTYRSERALKACYNHLVNLSGNNAETAAAIVQQSIANNWAGLFALKSQNNNEQRNSKNRQYNQEVDAAIIAGLFAE